MDFIINNLSEEQYEDMICKAIKADRKDTLELILSYRSTQNLSMYKVPKCINFNNPSNAKAIVDILRKYRVFDSKKDIDKMVIYYHESSPHCTEFIYVNGNSYYLRQDFQYRGIPQLMIYVGSKNCWCKNDTEKLLKILSGNDCYNAYKNTTWDEKYLKGLSDIKRGMLLKRRAKEMGWY